MAAEKQHFSQFKQVLIAALENNNIRKYQSVFEQRGLYVAVQYGQSNLGKWKQQNVKQKNPPSLLVQIAIRSV